MNNDILLNVNTVLALLRSDEQVTRIARTTDVNRSTISQYRAGKGIEHMTVGTALKLQAYAHNVGIGKD